LLHLIAINQVSQPATSSQVTAQQDHAIIQFANLW